MGDAEVHVVPTSDLVEHDLNDECVCGPASRATVRMDGSVGWVVVHHALDGRC